MKKIKVLLLIHIALSLSAGAQPPPECLGSMILRDAIILRDNFKKSLSGFRWSDSKFKVIDDFVKMTNPSGLKTEFKYPKEAICDMIDACRKGEAARADGVRMFLVAITEEGDPAITRDMINQVVPVWVPTVGGVNGSKILGRDGAPIYFYMVPGKRRLVRLSKKTIQSWNANYERILLRLSNHIGNKPPASHLKEKETRSVWYAMEKLACFYNYLKPNSPYPTGYEFALQFIVYKDSDSRNFEGKPGQTFSNVEVSRQLSIVFHFPPKTWANEMQRRLEKNKDLVGDTIYNKMIGLLNEIIVEANNKNRQDIIEGLQRQFISLYPPRLMDEDFDTGLPCPPDTHCIPLEP